MEIPASGPGTGVGGRSARVPADSRWTRNGDVPWRSNHATRRPFGRTLALIARQQLPSRNAEGVGLPFPTGSTDRNGTRFSVVARPIPSCFGGFWVYGVLCATYGVCVGLHGDCLYCITYFRGPPGLGGCFLTDPGDERDLLSQFCFVFAGSGHVRRVCVFGKGCSLGQIWYVAKYC